MCDTLTESSLITVYIHDVCCLLSRSCCTAIHVMDVASVVNMEFVVLCDFS